MENSKFRYLVAKRKSVYWNQIFSVTIFSIYFISFLPFAHSSKFLQKQERELFSDNCSTAVARKSYYINCNGVSINNLTALIEKEVENFPNGTLIIDRLFITNLTTDSGKLYQNWINTTKFRIKELFIETPDTNSIENNAFDGFAFEEMENLHLVQLKIEKLEAGTFEGLHFLKKLIMVSCDINQINQNALQGVAPNLTSISLIFMLSPINPTNLTGTVPLPKLAEVIIILNQIGSLDAGSFSQLVKAKTLRLYSNQIENISCGTFETTTALKWLELDDNLLTNLDSCIFSEKVITGLESLFVANNPWNCNCDLSWLKVLKSEDKIVDNPKCVIPFEDAYFCNRKLNVIQS